ncbi:sensor histidine kinase [Candidatus Uabimicrobium amorphum]|uniref:histidine kinase n=1 Tax=Uabimicrobium amorphum TaxID=2596890 RepID=A0A5S9IKG7_UABAM|nr:HAMP domain-containing sensor histidine kinase [Candidatus Uabimicrobium amorphum]BBM82245.1 PAS domain-containing sensor histidine kinase [Candidatus Uabimicrobium amorphum]
MNYRKFFISQIVLLALPSILLSSFAIYAILGQKAIITQKIEETYLHLLRSTQRRVSQVLGEKEYQVYVTTKNYTENETQQLTLLDPFYTHVFLVRNNKIVYPTQRNKNFPEATSLDLHNYNAFQQGHFYEFQEKDYPRAIEAYRQIPQDKTTLGMTLLAIARCYKKNNNFTKALDTYNDVATLFQDSKSLREFQLVVNAKLQMIAIKKYQQDMKQAYENCLLLLEFLYANKLRVPENLYTHYHKMVEEDIVKIKNNQDLTSETKTSLLQQHAQIIEVYEQKQQQELLLRQIRHLIDYIQKENKDRGYLQYKDNNEQHFIYFFRFEYSIALFKINIAALKKKLRTIVSGKQLGQEFFITIIDEAGRPINDIDKQAHMIISRPISNDFPFWSVAIYSQHASSLENLTRQKSYLYFGGIFFVIILLFMGLYVFISSFIKEIKSSRLQSDFVSNVTHELKTPLTSIKMFVETLLMDRVADKKEQLQCLNVIAAESDRLSRLIDRILDFAKMKENKRKFYFTQEDLGSVISKTATQFQEKRPDCSITLNIKKGLPQISLDVEAINQALMNLLSNAYKYTEKENKNIIISCNKKGKKYLEVRVKDNGIGVPRHEQQRIFQKFYRVEDRRAAKIEGTGLGLALVSSIIEAHKGKVNVSSKVGVGSEFTFSLPIHSST